MRISSCWARRSRMRLSPESHTVSEEAAAEDGDATGIAFNIQRFSIEDGPGIRTTVFMKGCPLRCKWCHNPEGLTMQPQLMWFDVRCIGARDCLKECPKGALRLTPDGMTIDRVKCDACGLCQDACPAGALEVVGKVYSFPTTSSAPAGQASWHNPQASHFTRSIVIPSGVKRSAPFGHSLRQSRAPMHLTSNHISCGCMVRPSGLWHHLQRSGQPFMNTVVLIPGPSSMEKRCMLKAMPVASPSSAAASSETV